MKSHKSLLMLIFLGAIICTIGCTEENPEQKEKKEELMEIKRYDSKSYRPEQPIKFSHKMQTAGMDCSYCHKDHTAKDTVLLDE